MTDIIEREGDRTYVNRLPPCGHSNGTHPSGCWYVAVCDAVAAERARIRAAVEGLPMRGVFGDGPGAETIGRTAVLRIIDGGTP